MSHAYKNYYQPPHLGEGGDLLSACQVLHGHSIGTTDGLSFEQLREIREWLGERLNRFAHAPPRNTYESIVLSLVYVAVAEFDEHVRLVELHRARVASVPA